MNSKCDSENEVSERRLCSECVGEKFLKEKISSLGEQSTCYYCDNEGKTFSVESLAEEIETAFDAHYYQTSTEPTGIEYTLSKEFGWERPGEPIVDVIGWEASVDEITAKDICEVLEELHSDMEMAQMGEESPFDSESYYAEKRINEGEYYQLWEYFEKTLKSESRYFSNTAEATLADIFQELEDYRTAEGERVIVEAGPDKQIGFLYRARVFQSSEKLKSALERPDLEVGPPSSALAKSGRMNATGISVFYGATEKLVAIAEVRPPVGSRVLLTPAI